MWSGLIFLIFTDDVITDIVVDLFAAGVDTASNSLSFFVLYMIVYPNIQRKIQDEIDQVIGRERKPTLADMKR